MKLKTSANCTAACAREANRYPYTGGTAYNLCSAWVDSDWALDASRFPYFSVGTATPSGWFAGSEGNITGSGVSCVVRFGAFSQQVASFTRYDW